MSGPEDAEQQRQAQRLRHRIVELERELDRLEGAPPELPIEATEADASAGEPTGRGARWTLASLVLVTAIFSILLRLIYSGQLEQTALLFTGLPTFLGVLLALSPGARTAVGMALKGVTLALLVSAIVFHEGFICILMAAPLFYGFAIVAAVLVDALRKPRTRVVGVLLLPLALSGVEGLHPVLSLPRARSVSISRMVPADPDTVRSSLASTPRFHRPLPFFLTLGFPRPLQTRGEGLDPGDERVIRFGGGEGRPGDMVLQVAEVSQQRVVFRGVSDTSHLAHWLSWDRATVAWTPEANGTRVTWTLDYTRKLDPAWWFAPWQDYAMTLAAGYLAETVTLPHG